MTRKIFRSILLVAGVVLAAGMVIMTGCLYSYFGGVQEQQLQDELSLAVSGVENGGTAYLERLPAERFRLTWIASDGRVLYDTQVVDVASMENHAGRQEVQEALKNGSGESSRYSDTLLQQTLYVARRLTDGTVLRISVSRATAGMLALGMLQPMLVVLAAALIFAGLMAGRLSRRIVDPLNRLDLEHPLENDAYEELAPLLSRINYQHKEIDAQLRTLRQKTDEFTQITGSMQEGLVLLDEKGTVLSINHAACRLFQADDGCVGRDFLTVDRSHELSLALETARKEGHSQLRCQRNGREYQLDMSRIQSGGETVGAVLLTFDVTEQEYAERNRREFTANVSHELKTPLQGIVGSAELIQSGMVKPEDMPRFVGHIHDEASRMVTLVEDIIRLSQLDEGDAMPTETVDLLALSQEAVTNLQDAAAKQQVSLSVDGGHAPVIGVRRLLYEVIFNLCDNAIKYNVPDGAVKVQVSSENGISSVTVSDTGIGIAPEHQSRVFERFYRVDKSHSKASGGTGLGLSIVKHAVQYHHGDIRLTSKPGEGTVIRITFPAVTR